MNHAYLWHNSFIYVWRDPVIQVTWHMDMCDMTYSYVWHDSLISGIWLSHQMTQHISRRRWCFTSAYCRCVTYVLQVCCSVHCLHAVLQSDAVCCGLLWSVASHVACGAFSLHVAGVSQVCCRCVAVLIAYTLQSVAVCCSLWQSDEVCCRLLQSAISHVAGGTFILHVAGVLQCSLPTHFVAVCCSLLQSVAVCYIARRRWRIQSAFVKPNLCASQISVLGNGSFA